MGSPPSLLDSSNQKSSASFAPVLENSVDSEPVKIDVGSSVELRVPITQLPVQKTDRTTLPNNKRRAAKIINKSQNKQKQIETENLDVEKSDNESDTCLGKRSRKVTTTKQYCF